MTPTPSPSPRTVGLWLAAAACAVTGVVLLTPGLPGSSSPTSAAPPSAASAAPTAAPSPTRPPAGSNPVSNPDGPRPTAARTEPSAGEQSANSARPPAAQGEHVHEDEDSTAPSATPLPTWQVDGHTDAHAPAAAEQQWRPVLTGFATDFTRRGSGTEDWAKRLSRWTTPQLARAYTDVDHRRVPTGTLVTVDATDVGAYTLSFTARYDSGLTVQGQAALGPDRWQVTTAQPATARSPG